jgi:DNA-binding NarL/FixJ family response regulator
MAGIIEVGGLSAPSAPAARREGVVTAGFIERVTGPAQPRLPTATVLVCDRLRAVADSLAEYLDSAPGLAVPGVATTAAQLLALLDAERPDLVVLDATIQYQGSAMPGDGLVAAVRQRRPATRVLMIGPADDPRVVARALREGAQGWLSVGSSASHLAEAAYGVLRGEYRIAPDLLAAALGAPAGPDAPAAGSGNTGAGRADGGNRGAGGGAAGQDEPIAQSRAAGGVDAGGAGALLARLSERERLVLSCLVGGMHRRDIAARLGIAETTARTHISRILTKLGAHSMIEAAALGRRAGLSAIEP